MRTLRHTWLFAVLTLFIGCGLANAQATAAAPTPGEAAKPTNLIDATNQYKAHSKELLNIQEGEVTKATAKLEELRKLVSDGLVARAELESAEKQLAGLREQLLATQKQIAASDSKVAEIQAQQERAQAAMPAKSLIKRVSKSYPTLGGSTIIRSSGVTSWSSSGLAVVQSFFSKTFGHALPTSAIGQSATHNRLGYDHRNAIDVGLHPDSVEGRTLISYLQEQGIPFLAFRAAIPGVATGPHIHIGSPSHRL
jgi:hypothetical protein